MEDIGQPLCPDGPLGVKFDREYIWRRKGKSLVG